MVGTLANVAAVRSRRPQQVFVDIVFYKVRPYPDFSNICRLLSHRHGLVDDHRVIIATAARRGHVAQHFCVGANNTIVQLWPLIRDHWRSRRNNCSDHVNRALANCHIVVVLGAHDAIRQLCIIVQILVRLVRQLCVVACAFSRVDISWFVSSQHCTIVRN